MIKKNLFMNTLSAASVQAMNYVLPFLLIPYLTRVLGVESYGLYAYGMSIVLICTVFVDYGFGIYGTYEVAKNIKKKHT